MIVAACAALYEKIACGMAMANRWSDPPCQILLTFFLGVPAVAAAHLYLAYYYGLLFSPLPSVLCWLYYHYVFLATPPAETEKFLTFKDAALKKRWAKNKIPMHLLVEEFIKDNVAFKGDDLLKVLEEDREKFIDWRPNWNLFQFLIEQIFPSKSSSYKDVGSTTKEIEEHYDRGNDFFAAFLGPRMVYTSAYYHGTDQTLEQAQDNKLNLICEKMLLHKPGMRHLDIGCGWGTLARHSATHFKASSVGVTLSKQGTDWCNEQNKKEGLKEGQCQILNCDYRLIDPSLRFDAISAVEMAEHVGIANFQLFLGNVRDMLTEDGIFYMQVAGLRKGSNWEDTQWGLFMSRYIFPGADASTPLFWYIKQLEMAGFEVRSVETVGRHYSHTLKAWYYNWMKNKEKPELAKYTGVWKGDAQLPHVEGNLSRLWEIFLSWSTIASGQGSATCYHIVAHKNKYEYPRERFCTADIAKRRQKLL